MNPVEVFLDDSPIVLGLPHTGTFAPDKSKAARLLLHLTPILTQLTALAPILKGAS